VAFVYYVFVCISHVSAHLLYTSGNDDSDDVAVQYCDMACQLSSTYLLKCAMGCETSSAGQITIATEHHL